jgi:uncharacterized DUF497 family protein
MLEWDRNNLHKIRAHGIEREEAEQALANNPILMYEQEADGEIRFLYYSETYAGRLMGIVVTQCEDDARVVTAYDLGARQKRNYFAKRAKGE